MSIATLKKLWLVGRLDEKTRALDALQTLGTVHLTDLSANRSDLDDAELSRSQTLSENLQKAIRYLEDSPVRRKQALVDEIDLESIIDEVLQNKNEKRDLTDQLEILREREETLKVWGNFRLPPLTDMGGFRLWFYILPYKHRDALLKLDLPWQIVHKQDNRFWVVLISQEEPPHDILPVERYHTGALPQEVVTRQRREVELTLEDIEADRQRYTRWISLLIRYRGRADDSSALTIAQHYSVDYEDVFVLRGWIETSRLASLSRFCEESGTAAHIEDQQPDELPPTLLENPESLKGGEMLVNFYQTPAYGSWDPSLILMISFSLFFAMILSDAGYSILLLVALALGWKTLGRSQTGKKLRPLLAALGGTSLVWGIVVGSYFGHVPAENTVFDQARLLDVNQFDTMMAISIGCGILHLLIANLQQAFLWRGSTRSLGHIGWALALVAGAVYAPSGPGTLARSSVWLLGGIATVLIFASGSDRKVTSPLSLLLRALEGLKALTNVTSMFGDVLSYLRLFALGLASTSLALTFNGLANNAFESGSGLGTLGGVSILLIGHTLNLVLAIVSGVVHGLRLNFIEFYKWALHGEGYPFRAFKKQEFPNE